MLLEHTVVDYTLNPRAGRMRPDTIYLPAARLRLFEPRAHFSTDTTWLQTFPLAQSGTLGEGKRGRKVVCVRGIAAVLKHLTLKR